MVVQRQERSPGGLDMCGSREQWIGFEGLHCQRTQPQRRGDQTCLGATGGRLGGDGVR